MIFVRGRGRSGFLLFEALIALLILYLALLPMMQGLGEIFRFSQRARGILEALSAFEEKLFLLETGERSDLVYFGGKEEGKESQWEVRPKEMSLGEEVSPYVHLEMRLKQGKEEVREEVILGGMG